MFSRLSRIVLGVIVLASGFGIGPGAHAATGTLEQITQRGALRVGLEGTYPPFNYQDEKGELVGFEVDFAKAIAQKLGVKAEFQPTKWDGILAALDAERFDVVINQVTVSPERRQKYDFSQPYTISGIQIITRRGNEAKISKPEDLTGKKVGVVLGSNYEQWLKTNSPKADIRTYDDDPTRNQDLIAGRIDAVLNDRLIVANLVKQYNGEIVAAGEPFAKQEQSIAFRKGDQVFRVAVDKVIDDLRGDGSLAKISEKWFGIEVTL
ncbi:cystine ABC transporter substrate-binding protein [Telmatospirillum sp.]|uniref:cystine ABC transporter substrate-binding protein n=1 Tax=Telmatospirillum sp. TaxID=2079197 RepID=UPI0028414B3F|nr:cystine ABC transporter substrate-binding protein [Telmatospirillum sp.]MDR3437426.1 cystine ABC transporter substrate-binding protein [Telmatospirillum sp.]